MTFSFPARELIRLEKVPLANILVHALKPSSRLSLLPGRQFCSGTSDQSFPHRPDPAPARASSPSPASSS